MPVEQRLELVASIRPNGVDPERKFPDHVIDEIDGALLVVALVDLQCTNPRRVVNRRVLVAADCLPSESEAQGQSLN
jgi:hypothetical protein